jgi:hypothetical protein
VIRGPEWHIHIVSSKLDKPQEIYISLTYMATHTEANILAASVMGMELVTRLLKEEQIENVLE